MASIPITIQGVMFYTDVGVGGGPMPGGPGGAPQPPVYPAHPIAGGPWPSHPIYGPQPPQPPGQPQPPLGIWGPPDMPPGFWGGGMGPGVKPQPHPEHPIYFPPPGSPPPLGIWGPPDMPPGFWGGGMGPGVKPQPKPEHPIVLPPNLPPEIPPPNGGSPIPIDWKVAWTPTTGWIVVGVPSGAHPAPSK